MPDYTAQPQNTFVVRFWREWRGVDAKHPPGWRGRVEHVQSGEGTTFRDSHQLLAFIERFVASLSAPSRDEETYG